MVIDLYRPPASFETDSDGFQFKSTTFSQYTPGRYTSQKPPVFQYVPSLSYICLKILQNYPESIHQVGNVRLSYRPAPNPQAFDLVRALVPSYARSAIDPRLWVTLVQLYDNLPPELHTYSIPLGDEHIPLLQTIPSTEHFSLITILDLSGCALLTDDNIAELKPLHTLLVLDASRTALSSLGIMLLAEMLLWTTPDDDTPARKRGPWQLRILHLRDCRRVDKKVVTHLKKFPLLSVIDLRGTQCPPNAFSRFVPCPHSVLFHPHSLSDSLDQLAAMTPKFYSSSNSYALYIDTLYHHDTVPELKDRKAWRFPQRPTAYHPPKYNLWSDDDDAFGDALSEDQREDFSEYDEIDDSSSQGDEQSGLSEQIALQLLSEMQGYDDVDTEGYNELDTEEIQAVADEELQSFDSLEMVRNFYGRGYVTRNWTPLLKPQSQSSPQDSGLALWRKPPPWNILDLYTKPTPAVRTQSNSEVASVNRSKKKRWLEEQQAELQQMDRSSTLKPPSGPANVTSISTAKPSQSKNPFQRKSSTKVLKPISSMNVPTLPKEVHSREKPKRSEVQSGSSRLKQTKLSGWTRRC